jgi:tetratricopeptide (TPR) repeat protein
MSVTQPKTIEALLHEGTQLYEKKNIFDALARWRDILNLDPEHSTALHYIEFVQGHFNLKQTSSRYEMQHAQDQYGRLLRGEPDPQLEAQQADDLQPAEVEQYGSSRQLMGESSVELSSMQATPLKIQEDEETQTPDPIPAERRPIHERINSPVAQQALVGPPGPKTQAEGLSIQSLSRQLADLHRAGKYEKAVDAAEELLKTDPQHAVARRYIQEYHRQKQNALARQQLQKDKVNTQPLPESSSNDESLFGSLVGSQVESSRSQTNSKPASQSISNADLSDVPTVAPQPQVQADIQDLSKIPKILVRTDQISWKKFDHRAGFFFSQVDGKTSYEDLLEISGMPRKEALSILNQLVQHGLIG